MATIDTPDPYLSHYVYEKIQNPSTPLVWRQYPRKMVEMVDHIIELAHGHRETVKTVEDWGILNEIIGFWAHEYPDEFNAFKESIRGIRQTRARSDGYSRFKGTSGVRYLAAMPPRLMRLIKAIFPNQQYDRPFMGKLVRNFPFFKVAEKINQW